MARVHGEHGICGTCRNAQVMETRRGETIVMCTAMRSVSSVMRVTIPLVFCSAHEDKNTPTSWDMEKIAWTLSTDTKGRVVGFTAPKKRED